MSSKMKISLVFIAFFVLATLAIALGYFYNQKSLATKVAEKNNSQSVINQATENGNNENENESMPSEAGDQENAPAQQEMTEEQPTALHTGVNLDCARKYCSPEELKKYIDLVAESENGFVQLHLTDNQNVGVECRLLDQRATEENRNTDGSYTNPRTKKKFLSREQIMDLRRYAEQKKVVLVPEIDLPAHAGGFLRLARLKHGNHYVRKVAANLTEGELDIAGADGLEFAKNSYAEYAELFAGNRYFHIGCDELFSASAEDKLAFIQQTTEFFQSKGFTVRLWNDFITKKNLGEMPAGVEVTYWSYDGDTEDDAERMQRRRVRASLPELQAQNIAVLNYNSYYLYFVPSLENSNQWDMDEMLNDIKRRWDLQLWDSEYGKKTATTEGIIGAAVSVWREDSHGVSPDKIYNNTSQFYRAMAKKVESENIVEQEK